MNLYALLEFVHVLTAFWLLAGIAGRQLTRAYARRAEGIETFTSLTELAGRFESLMVMPGTLAVLASGIVLALIGSWPLLGFLQGASVNWLLASLILAVLVNIPVPAIFVPRGKVFDAAWEEARQAGQITPKLLAALDDPVVRYAHLGEFAALVAFVFLMVVKPF